MTQKIKHLILYAFIGGAVFLCGRSTAFALIEAGVGFSSVNSGRQVPAISLGLGIGSWIVSGQSVGTKSGYSYVSSYALGVYKSWKPGKLLSGDIVAGFGLGIFFTERGYKPDLALPLEIKSDFGGGPAFRANWYALGPMYIGIEGIFGLRNMLRNLTLSYQDYILFSVGVGW